MRRNPYKKFQDSERVLTDELAMDRTAMANERTLLSYIRTGLAFGITGAGVIKFFESFVPLLLGWGMVVLGVLVVVLGVWHFRRIAGHISACRTPDMNEID